MMPWEREIYMGLMSKYIEEEKEKNYLRRMQPNINNRTNINNFTTVNANNNSSRSDTTVSARNVDNSNFSFNGTLG